MKTRIMILFAALCVAMSVAAQSAQTNNGGAGAQSIFNSCSEMANQGDTHAQEILSNMYEEGLGVAKDPQKAAYWKKKYEEAKTIRKIGNSDFSTKPTNYYNLDVIISVGYGQSFDGIQKVSGEDIVSCRAGIFGIYQDD